MSSACQFLTDNLDLYGKTVNLHLFGKEKYKTKLGLVFSLFTILTIVTISLFFLKDLFSYNIMTIIFNQDETLFPVVNMTNMPMMFTMADASGIVIRPERLYTFDLKKAEVVIEKKIDSNGQLIQRVLTIVQTPISVEPCDRDKHIPKEYHTFLDTIKLTNFYCVANMSDLVIYGKDGDYFSGFSALQLYLNRCQNSTLNNNSCYDEATIDEKLRSVYFNFGFMSYQVNHYNYTQPQQLQLQTITSEVTSSFLKRYHYYLSQVLYNTDNGLVFENYSRENFYTYDTFDLEIGIINTSTSNFAHFSFGSSRHVDIYSRSYIKFQNFLANIGGFFKAVMVIAEFCVTIITRKFYLLDLSNSIFNFYHQNFNDNENKEIKINTTNMKILQLDKNIIKKNNSLNNSNEPNSDPDLLNHIRKSKKLYSKFKYKEKLVMNMCQLLCPKFCFKNKNKIQNLEKCESFIIKNISVENIIDKFNELDSIIKNILNESQYKEIKETKKIIFKRNINTDEIGNTMHNIKKCNSNEINLHNLKLKSFPVKNQLININNVKNILVNKGNIKY